MATTKRFIIVPNTDGGTSYIDLDDITLVSESLDISGSIIIMYHPSMALSIRSTMRASDIYAQIQAVLSAS